MRFEGTEAYVATDDLKVAVNAAITLERPLLVKGEPGMLHPMQEAFREHHALQCGYCTPGMIMAALDIVRRKGNDLDDHTIREQLDGNLCRCTGYHNIVKAIAAGAKAMANGRPAAT